MFFNLQMPFGIQDKSPVPLGISRKKSSILKPKTKKISEKLLYLFHLIMT